jgi:hypothetical protein
MASPGKSSSNVNPNICTKCIGSKRFAAWIRKHGKRGQCEIEANHGSARKVVPLSEFAEVVDNWFRESYAQGSEER